MEVVASHSQGRTAAAQCGLFTHKSVPVIFEPPFTFRKPTLSISWRTMPFHSPVSRSMTPYFPSGTSSMRYSKPTMVAISFSRSMQKPSYLELPLRLLWARCITYGVSCGQQLATEESAGRATWEYIRVAHKY